MLGLSDEQRSETYYLRKRFLEKLDTCMRARKDINSRLLRSDLPNVTAGPNCARYFLATHEAVRQLKQNLVQEHHIFVDFVITFYRKVLNIMQFAKMVVCSFPLQPDSMAITHVIAKEAQRTLGLDPYNAVRSNPGAEVPQQGEDEAEAYNAIAEMQLRMGMSNFLGVSSIAQAAEGAGVVEGGTAGAAMGGVGATGAPAGKSADDVDTSTWVGMSGGVQTWELTAGERGIYEQVGMGETSGG